MRTADLLSLLCTGLMLVTDAKILAVVMCKFHEQHCCAGEQLASGADMGEVMLWRVDQDAVRDEETTWQRSLCRRDISCLTHFLLLGCSLPPRLTHGMVAHAPTVTHVRPPTAEAPPRRGHTEDVQDIAWAPDATALATCSIDHNTVLWTAAGGPGVARLQDHRHYVQGAAWDPAARFLVTQSSDRTCRRALRCRMECSSIARTDAVPWTT